MMKDFPEVSAMPRYEFKVVPAPKRGEKVRGARTPEDRFAQALTTVMNQFGRDGWEYIRADMLPCETRTGLTGRTTTTYQHMLVFRRQLSEIVSPDLDDTPAVAPPPERRSLTATDPLQEKEPLSEAAARKLASVLPMGKAARSEGPRLVSPRTERPKAPTLGPARGPEADTSKGNQTVD